MLMRAAETRRLYGTSRWQALRRRHLSTEPLCRMCLAAGLLNDGGLTAGGEVQRNAKRRHLVCDHIVPHRGDVDAFWRGPFQTLCPDHHDRAKQIEETKGFSVAVGGDGWPIDPGHPANR